MSTIRIDDHVERSVVLWHLQVSMATFYTQNYPKEMNKRKPYQSIQFTDTVYCSHQRLNHLTFAAPIYYFNHLTTIQLEDNRLTQLPPELWHLSVLEKLNLGRNNLTELPIGIGLLIRLKELYLHENQLSTLPSQIGQLVDLRVLDLTNNRSLTYLPWEITQLNSSLRRLWIDGISNNDIQQQQEQKIPSLFNLCAQLTGSLLAPTQIDNARLPPSLLSFLVTETDPSLVRRCSQCQTVLYYIGIPLLNIRGTLAGQTIPLLYHVCGQTCRNRWLTGMKQDD